MAGEYDQDIIKGFQEEFQEQGIDKMKVAATFSQLQSIRMQIIALNTTTNMFTSLRATGGKTNVFDEGRILTKSGSQDDKIQRALLFQAYELIQKLREYLTGEVLTYHLYVTTQGESGYSIKQISVPGDQLINYFTAGKRQIAMRIGAVKKAYDQMKDVEKASKLQKHWEDVMSLFKNPQKGTYKNTVWIYQPKEIERSIEPPPVGSAQVFNLGHIVEAVDIANSQIPPEDNFLSLFEAALEYDSVSGFKGGDNQMIQVKANSARLMRYSSIMNALDSVIDIQNSLNNFSEAMKKIRELYYSSSMSPSIDERLTSFIKEEGENLIDMLVAKT